MKIWKYVGLAVLVLAIFLTGVAVGFRVSPEKVNYQLVGYSAEKGSIWDTTGEGGPLYEKGYLAVKVTGEKETADIYQRFLVESLNERRITVVSSYPRCLIVNIENFSTKSPLGLWSIKRSSQELAQKIAKQL